MVGEGRSTAVLQQTVLRRALAARDASRLHVHFDGAVVDRYRGHEGAQLLRTRSVGRVFVPGRWSLDVGIAPDGSVHVPFGDLVDRLPEAEWPHWVEHVLDPPSSLTFLQMRLSAGACIDDGETEAWV
ncbi:MAG: hypothetical protein U0360_10060 [Dehalococcoidia bacterium]